VARPAPWLGPLSLVAAVGMLAAIPLGFISWRTGPVPHAAVAIVAALLSIIAHVRRGGGGDLGASLLLGLGVVLGIGVPDGVVSVSVHWVLATAGVLLSAWVHLKHLVRPAPRAAPKT
jgi:hypothetical protein